MINRSLVQIPAAPPRFRVQLWTICSHTHIRVPIASEAMTVGRCKIRVITLRAKLSGAVYCYRSCLWRGGRRVFVYGCVCLWVCYHNNSKLRASIFTKLGL